VRDGCLLRVRGTTSEDGNNLLDGVERFSETLEKAGVAAKKRDITAFDGGALGRLLDYVDDFIDGGHVSLAEPPSETTQNLGKIGQGLGER